MSTLIVDKDAKQRLADFVKTAKSRAKESENSSFIYYIDQLCERLFNVAIALHQNTLNPLEDNLSIDTANASIHWAINQYRTLERLCGVGSVPLVTAEKRIVFDRMMRICKGQKVTFSKVKSHYFFKSRQLKALYCQDPLRVSDSSKALTKDEVYRFWCDLAQHELVELDPYNMVIEPKKLPQQSIKLDAFVGLDNEF